MNIVEIVAQNVLNNKNCPIENHVFDPTFILTSTTTS